MAKKTDPNLAFLYASCYLEPTAHSHATAYGIERRLREEEASHNYRDISEEEAKHAVHLGHNLILRVLWLQDSHFRLGLEADIQKRAEAFVAMYGKEESPTPP